MKISLTKFSKLGFVVAMIAALSLSSCSEDIIDPDNSAMPPKNTIKLPPQKD